GRAGLRALRRARPPWWTYLGGVGGAVFVTGAAYAVPVLGVAVFTVAQVAGSGLGGLGVDRAGLAPVGRLALTGPRVAGAALGVAAVVVSQLGRPVGGLPVAAVAVAVLGGVAVAVQGAVNGRLAAASSPAAGTLVNFAVNLPLMLLAVAGLGLLGPAAWVAWPTASVAWPTDWYLFAGGLLGGGIVAALVFAVQAVGVLRTGLAVVAGQLLGALLLDTALPGGPGLSAGAVVGAGLTVVAVVVAGRGGRRAAHPGGAHPGGDRPGDRLADWAGD
ncbi:MAG TPA: DMT family transporter, partial [Pilimelia sp.]|nr:DMT family transporter [Pilimelia sp.]